MDKILEINEKVVEDHLGKLVRSSVEDTLNALLDAEADRICTYAKPSAMSIARSARTRVRAIMSEACRRELDK